jgi:hypothetical protein
MTRAKRFNSGKPQYSLIPPEALEELARLYTKGGEKYGDPRNWEKGMPYLDVYDSLMRHAQKWRAGGTRDPETDALHMIAVAWNAIALATYELRGLNAEWDNRPTPSVTEGESPTPSVKKEGGTSVSTVTIDADKRDLKRKVDKLIKGKRKRTFDYR